MSRLRDRESILGRVRNAVSEETGGGVTFGSTGSSTTLFFFRSREAISGKRWVGAVRVDTTYQAGGRLTSLRNDCQKNQNSAEAVQGRSGYRPDTNPGRSETPNLTRHRIGSGSSRQNVVNHHNRGTVEALVGKTLRTVRGQSIIRNTKGTPTVDIRIDIAAGRITGFSGLGKEREKYDETSELSPATYWGPLIGLVIKNFDKNAVDGRLFEAENLLSDVLESLNSGELAQRRFREIARIAGLVFSGYPGAPKSMKQVQASAGLFWEVFRKYDAGNRLLTQAENEVLAQELELSRLTSTLQRMASLRIEFVELEVPSPFALPLMVERFREVLSTEKFADRLARILAEAEAVLAEPAASAPRKRKSR